MLFKKNEARSSKSMGKSLGGHAAAALAEARAAAEARVAERHKLELGVPSSPEGSAVASESKSPVVEDHPLSRQEPEPPTLETKKRDPEASDRRLSVSDLAPATQSQGKEKAFPVFSKPVVPVAAADTSATTTPPTSPPRSRTTSFVAPTEPVFSKPTGPLPTAAPSVSDFKLPTTNPFSIPAAMALGMGTKFAPLSAQSSKASVFSDVVFDRTQGQSPGPGWMTSTQDTSYSVHSQNKGGDLDTDPDDSWGVDEKFAGDQWTPYGFQSANVDHAMKDDTWSTIPSRSTSQKGGDTGTMFTQGLFGTMPIGKMPEEEEDEKEEPERGFAERMADAAQQGSDGEEDGDDGEAPMDMDIDEEEPPRTDTEDESLASKPTIKLVPQVCNTPCIGSLDLAKYYVPQSSRTDLSSQPRSDSQQSMASSASSQSNLGFFGHASKLVSSVLGGGKKGKPEVKSLQLAAAAAKKQQEEQEKKATRLKEMENRRQLAMQRKADEEKARAQEEERKIKEAAERRKREREEQTDKRPLRSTTAPAKKVS